MADIDSIKKDYNEILKELADPGLISDWEKFEELAKKKSELEKIIAKQKEIEEIQKQVLENKEIFSGEEDRELISLAEAEISGLRKREIVLKKEVESLLKGGSGEEKIKSVIVEIRAGAGGEEAALFCSDLFNMYSKYGQKTGWERKILDSRPTDIGGLKEIIFELKSAEEDVFSKIKYESGVHRVQRVPSTEKAGRIHTSTATVAVLAKPKKTEIKINPAALKIDFFRSSGPGGQYVNKRETAVRITHIPTGISAACQTERNQLKNRENAMAILEAKVFEKITEYEAEKIAGNRKSQIGGAKRAEKIRTYNFPQNRLTDHRIKKSWRNLDKIIEGNLDPIIESIQTELK